MKKLSKTLMSVAGKLSLLVASTAVTSYSIGAEYPENIDYGTKGDFVAKRGVEFGRTAILMPIGPVLVNLPEGPGSSPTGLTNGVRLEDSIWDISSLTDPTLISSLGRLSGPIHSHATVVRFDERGAMLHAGGNGELIFDPDGANSEEQVQDVSTHWDQRPLGYARQTSPYYMRSYWNYNNSPDGQFAIRDTTKQLESGPTVPWHVNGTPWEDIFGSEQLGVWLGEPLVWWDHLALTSVTGFTSWLGNLLVVASDQQATGIAIYDVSGYKEGLVPKLLSVFKPTVTEPNGNTVGVGGYWVESYGTNKMVYAARKTELPVNRDYSSMFVVDFSDPRNPYLSCAVHFDQDRNDLTDGDGSSDPMYVNYQDQFAYVDHFKVDIEACEEAYADDQVISKHEFDEIVYKFDDIANECDSSQYFRPLGQVGVFGGYDFWETDDINEQGMCFFVTDDQPDTLAPYIAGHTPAADQTDYPIDGFIHIHIPETLRTESVEDAITVRNMLTNQFVEFTMQLSHTGVISIWPEEYLSVQSPYEVTVSGIQDYIGNTMSDYSFVFSTDDGDFTRDEPEIVAPTIPAPSYAGIPYYPNKSSQLSCQAEIEGADIWVVNPDNDSVSIISQQYDADTFEITPVLNKEIKLLFEAPTSVSKVVDNFAVTHRDDDKVVVYDAQGYPLYSIDTGHGTQPVASVANGSDLYVALYASGEVIQIDTQQREIVQRLIVGPTPKAMALFDERLLVTRFISAQQHGEVYDLDISEGLELTRTITVNKITVADDIVNGSGVPNYLASIVISNDGEQAYIAATKANTDRGLVRNGLPLDDDNTVRPIIAVLDLVNNIDANFDPSTIEGSLDLDNKADPAGVTFLADPNARAYTLQGNNIVVAANPTQSFTNQFATGFGPQEMCTTLRTLYVKNFTDRTVSAIDVSGFIHDGRLGQNIQTVSTVSEEVLTEKELKGLQIFYHSSMPEMGQEGYISCASCHAGGGHDGRTWDITSMGEGVRNTISLNGASGTRFGNLHWSGNFDEVQDFEIQMEQLNGGDGLVPGTTFTGQSPLAHVTSGLSDELDALAAYVNGLGKDTVKRSPFKAYNGDLSEVAQYGKSVFVDKGCDGCHTGQAFRDGLTHDVGTITLESGSRLGGELTAIRTPSLIELWDSAPYFHDGSAVSLEDVLSKGTHAVSFNEGEQQALIQYLLSIDREEYIDDAQ